jgi:uncharacterized membrane protein YcaP (DUF421 family)
MGSWFFDDWSAVGRLVAVAVPAYVSLVLLLRISGKRTLSKMNAFDLVVTVAFGSTLATALLSPQTSLVQAVLAFAFLVLAQYCITWLSVRARSFQRLVKASPSLLYFRGRLREEDIRRERVTRVELEAVCRQQGYASLARVDAVVLETDGSLSVIEDAGELTEGALARALAEPGDPGATSPARQQPAE